MAIFHFSAKVISAAEGQSAVAAAAYRHGASFQRDLTGQSHNYEQKTEVTHEEITLPPDAPAWAKERYLPGPEQWGNVPLAQPVSGGTSGSSGPERLWNDIEAREQQHNRRATAQLAREIEFSLPIEMTHEEHVALAREYITSSLAGRGYACDWVIHAKEDNPHVHVMFTERRISEDGWGNKIQTSNRRQQLLELRAEWAMMANRHLERGGYEARIDHRSHADRGLTVEPGVHRGSEPGNAEDYAAWKARAAEDAAIRTANERWLLEHPEELVKLVGVTREEITRPALMAEALNRISFPDRREAEAYVDSAIQSGALMPVATSEVGDETWNSVIHLQQVRDVVAVADSLAVEPFSPAEAVAVDALDVTPAAAILNDGQRAAAEAVLSPDSRLALISGLAGAGKTRMLQVAAEVLTDQGIAVLGAAPSGRAAAELESPHIRTRTVAGWLQQRMAWVEEGQPFVFILDEAGMVGMNDVAALIQAVQMRGGKVVMIGDAEQLQPIAAGTPFRALRDRHGCVEMAWVQRQRDVDDRRATIALARGRAREALDHYARKGAITQHLNVPAAATAIAAEYWKLGGRAVALAHRNVDVAEINKAVRAAGVEQGRVSDITPFATRDGVVSFGVGDRVIATGTLPRHKVLKGAYGVVQAGADGRLEIAFDGHDAPVLLDAWTAGRIALGYAVTVHKSQGMTADHALVLATGTMDRHLGYVAFSRHRDHLRIHIDGSSVSGTADLAGQLRRSGLGVPPPAPQRSASTRVQGVDAPADPDPRAVAAFGSSYSGSEETLRPDVPYPDIQPSGPAMVPNDGHVEAVIVHYSNLLAAASPDGIFRTETGQRLADDPAELARHMAAQHSAWTVHDAAMVLARHIVDPLTYRRVLTDALRNPDVMTLLPESPEDPERLLSTWSRVQLEADMVADAGLLAERRLGMPGAVVPAAARLTDEQRETLQKLFGGPALQIVDGGAGAGKSGVAAALHDAAVAGGVDVSLIVPTENDAVLMRAAISRAGNVLTARQPTPADSSPRLWIVDGAEAIGQAEMSRVLRLAQQTGGRVVLTGDSQSIEPLVAGSPFVALCERFAPIRMVGSLRGRTPDEQAFVRHLAAGSGVGDREAIAHLDRTGRLVGAPDMETAMNQAVAGYLADGNPDKALLAHTRAQVRALNAVVLAAMKDRSGRVVRMLGGGSLDLASGDVVVVQQASPGSVVPTRQQAVVTSLSEDGGRIGLDFGEHAEGGRYATVAASSIRLEHGWARTISSTRASPASTHLLAGPSNNRQTVYAGMSRHRDQVRVYVPDLNPADFLGRLLATLGRQRFALDYASALAPDGQRMLADYLEADGGATETWLDAIHRSGRGRAFDRAMITVGDGLLGYGDDWLSRMIRVSAIGTDATAQRWLQAMGPGGRGRPNGVLTAIGAALTHAPGSPRAHATGVDGWLKDASMVLSVAVDAAVPEPDRFIPGDSQAQIRRTLALGTDGTWLDRRLLRRRAEAAARTIAETRAKRRAHDDLLDELNIPRSVTRHRDSWSMVPPAVKAEYERRLPDVLDRVRAIPTEIDRAVARAEVAAVDRQDTEAICCAAGMRAALEAAPVRSAAEISRDRDAMLQDLSADKRMPADTVFHRLHRAFTAPEIEALMTPSKALPPSMPSLDAAVRERVAQRLVRQARDLSPALSVPWAGRVRSLARDGWGRDGWSI